MAEPIEDDDAQLTSSLGFTSGGTRVAMIGVAKGYRVEILMSEKASEEA